MATAERLSDRIDDRFKGRGISVISDNLVIVARRTQDDLDALNRPRWPLRIAIAAVVLGLLAIVALAAAPLDLTEADVRGFDEWIMVFESAIQDVIFIGLAAVFLRSIEGRMRRREALGGLHELRSMAHVIDMHQLTKDPEALLAPEERTEHSPDRTMSRFELTRYLDYCSEMLSIIAKLAAMYAQENQDGLVLVTVREIESLTSNLSSEVWQKMILLQDLPADA